MKHTARNFGITSGILLITCLILTVSGCSLSSWETKQIKREDTKLVIPDFDNAKDQYTFATAYQQATILSTDRAKRKVQLDKIIQCHTKVVENFPNDRTYTPLSFLAIAAAKAGQEKYGEARSLFQEAMQKWPDNDYVQAQALFAIAQTYASERKFSQAQELYRQVIERFKDNPTSGVQRIVANARALYYTVKEEPANKEASPRRGILQRLKSL
ncbi:MAG: tetratricopeptide repeat protein [Candidatus Hydrogenedentota bacterium]|jgi:TolA-binding protein|uniref:Uncharacterized protein n=1 Tax=Sumerlaea chitinivorans TaxID=2250252 RepID=A0A2Z4Y3H9_SUMC1|nr:hypothetical protein BRCON_0762 [Candidatus Sumerlaea chitinivorans]RMH27579.1 MAG: tetratricopeptide repeat protein [Candidatus Hydrogenedentota bacterium]GIX44547.1 MAG: hypothetical protein KatS3mg130_0955 [Candidatus Sumerlaea sp.]